MLRKKSEIGKTSISKRKTISATMMRDYYASLDARYDGHKYPDRALVQEAIQLMDDVFFQKKDNIALIERVLKKEDPSAFNCSYPYHAAGISCRPGRFYFHAIPGILL